MDFQQSKVNPVEEDNFQEFDGEKEETLSLCDLALNNTINVSDSDQEDRSSSFDQDLFEFFSTDFTSTISTYPKDKIIFCGKMIPFKGENQEQNLKNSVPESKVTKKSFVYMWKYSYTLSERRPRARWYLFAFGMGRNRGEMELKDLKMRQSKFSDGKRRQRFKCDEKEEETVRCKGVRKWWSLVRILGCQGSHANAMVKASLGLMPK